MGAIGAAVRLVGAGGILPERSTLLAALDATLESSLESKPCPPAEVAQSVEHTTENRGVGGSIPPLGTRPAMPSPNKTSCRRCHRLHVTVIAQSGGVSGPAETAELLFSGAYQRPGIRHRLSDRRRRRRRGRPGRVWAPGQAGAVSSGRRQWTAGRAAARVAAVEAGRSARASAQYVPRSRPVRRLGGLSPDRAAG